ncbi:mucin-3A-like isoform X2 [Channa argus]|uniref:mucin-3A-like isoform X2 n=1 Tax=Channa argus TaxID=215402 RepID=UPI003522238B
MKFDIKWVLCAMVVLTGASQTKGQSSASPPVHTSTALLSHMDTSEAPGLTEDPGHNVPQQTLYPEVKNHTSAETTTKAQGTVKSETETNGEFKHSVPMVMVTHTDTTAPSALPSHPGRLSFMPPAQSTTPLQRVSTTETRPLLTTEPLTTFPSQPTQAVEDVTSITQHPQSKSLMTASTQTTAHPLSSAPGWSLVGPTHQELPPELNVGDEDLKGPRYRSSSPLDPLLAGLLSVFIVTTAIVFIVLFLKFRQQTNQPEFHRLQDLPMDDLMEDTPLSRYTY